MAKRYKQRTGNCKPTSSIQKTRDLVYSDGGTIGGVIRNVWNEVGRTGQSSFSGVDPNGVDLKAITYAKRAENMFRYDLINGAIDDDWNDDDDPDGNSTSLIREYYYDQGKKEIKKGKKALPKWEYACRPDYTYEEEYFQHIFNWPTSHTTVARKIAGRIQEDINCTTTSTDGQGNTTSSSSSSTVYWPLTSTYPSKNLTLSKVVSKLYYIDNDWNYVELPLNADGSVNGDAVTDRIGEPIIYHGGTDDKTKLFFHYVVEGTAVATDNVIAVGDQINGITVSNIVNYIVDVALKRTVSKHAKKRTEDREVSQSQFLAANPNHTSQLYTDTKAWIKLNSADGIEIGDIIWGKGIAKNTVITGVDEVRKRVYISNTIRAKKVKILKIRNDTVNKVNKNTLCYAVLASDASFSADGNYSVTRNGASTGITICARAGAGIINRSAVVGIYNSKNKKDVEYEPIFYASDPNCEKIKISDANGEYTLGTRVYGDNSRDEGLYLMNSPATNTSYQIAAMYYAATNGPIDKANLEGWISQYNRNGNNILEIYGAINAYALSTLGGKKVAGAIDDTCGDPIVIDYTKVYNPVVELSNITDNIQSVSTGVEDICITETDKEPVPTSLNDVQERFKEVVAKSISKSSYLSEEYYKKLISDDDSLFNRINTATNISLNSIPKATKIDNLPPQIEGQDQSGQRFISESYRNLPPAMDRVKYLISDIMIGTDEDLNPTLNLDPATTRNQPKIIISSIPVWSVPAGATYSHTFGSATQKSAASFTVSTSTNSYSGLETITTSYTGPTPASITETTGSGDSSTTCVYTYSWMVPTGNRIYKEHKETFEQGGYVQGTNWHIHPDIRDLDNKDWPDDDRESEHLQMQGPVYPKTIWAPNINYQRDFHKMFWFRPSEVTELIGETIENSGNPYLDDPIRAKITQTIGAGDTTIHVQSTDGFLSSGYLIIPKYTKKFYTVETANSDSQYTYAGEEIIYYKSKTSTTFENCERECFGTTSEFITTIPVTVIETGVRYQIVSLGTTNWKNVGAPDNAQVGTIFVATGDGEGSGTVKIYGTTDEEVPDPDYIAGVEKPPLLPSISSYEKGHSISQHWIFRLKED